MRLSTVVVLLLLSSLLAFQAAGQSTPIRILCSNGLRAVVEELRARAERETGRSLSLEFGTSVAIRQRIQSGEAFDVTILNVEVLDDLIKAGKITAGTRVDLGQSGIGVGVRSGAPKPDIKTMDQMKSTLLKAKSMTWVDVGASRVHIDKMLQQLGIVNDVKPKIILTQSVDQSLELVANGKAELILTLISEIVPAKGVDYAGPFPPQAQNYVRLAAGLSSASKNADPAKGVIKVLSAPSSAGIYKSKGMELIAQGVRP